MSSVCENALGHLQAQRDIPVPIRVVLFKHIRHPLQGNASLHEQIKRQHPLPLAVVASSARMSPRIRAKQQLHKLRAQAISKRHQRILKLAQTNAATLVDVKAVKQPPPRGEEAPEAAKLVEVDGAGAVGVEHADHHLDRVRVEGGVVAVDEGTAQLFF